MPAGQTVGIMEKSPSLRKDFASIRSTNFDETEKRNSDSLHLKTEKQQTFIINKFYSHEKSICNPYSAGYADFW